MSTLSGRQRASRLALTAVVALACLTPATVSEAAGVGGCAVSVSPGQSSFAAGSDAGAIAVASDGRAWISLQGSSSLGRIGTSTLWTVAALASPAADLAAGPDGNLWMTTGGPSVVRRTLDGNTSTFSTTQDTDSLAVGPDGNLWFTTFGDRIGRITPAGVVTEFSTGVSPEPLQATTGSRITAGPDGSLWYTRSAANRIGRISVQGVVTEFAAGLPVGGAPSAIAPGSDGNVWFTLPGTGDVGRITPAGVVTTFPTGRGAVAGLRGIALGSDGTIYTTSPGTLEILSVSNLGVVTGYGSLGVQALDLVSGPDGAMWASTATGYVALFNGCTGMKPPYVWVGGATPDDVTRIVQDGSNQAPVTALTPIVSGVPRMSPDRGFVAWVEGAPGAVAVRTATVAGTSARTIWSGAAASLPVWSPDGTALAFAGEGVVGGIQQSGLFRVLVSTGAVTFVPHTTLGGEFNPSDWSADGAIILGSQKTYPCDGIAGQDLYEALAAVTIATGDVTLLTSGPCRIAGNLVADRSPSLSADGRFIAYVQVGGTSAVKLLDLGTLVSSTLSAGDPIGQPTWAPDGFRVFYLSDNGASTLLRSVRRDGTDDMVVGAFNGSPGVAQWAQGGTPVLPTVSPDGTVVPLPSSAVSTRTPVGASLTGLAAAFHGVCTFTLLDGGGTSVATRSATAAGGTATVPSASGFGTLAEGTFAITASCAGDGTMPATNPVTSPTVTSTALIYLVPGPDPALNRLMAALADQIPELVVATDGAPLGSYTTPDCSTGAAPRPGSDDSVALLVDGQPYTSTSGTTVTPAPGCVPDAGTVYGP